MTHLQPQEGHLNLDVHAKPALLIAEDDASLRDVLELMFSSDFSVSIAADGNEAVDLLQDHTFELVLLDIHLPERNGIEVCQFISELSVKDQPGIIVISGDMTDALIKQAYSLGVGDYIAKPFNVVAFHQRVMRYSRDLKAINELREKDLQKRSLAETAMTQAASYGAGLELLAKLNRSKTVEQFLQDLTQGLLSRGYHTAVEFRYFDDKYRHDSDTAECGENEIKVFQLLHDKGRIYNFGKRAIFNEHNSSILIKNMPQEGTMSYDAAIDLFAKLVPALNSRFIALMHVETMNSTKSTLAETVQIVTDTIATVAEERQQHLQDIATTIGISFHELELTETQENFFLDLIEKKLGKESGTEQFNYVVNLLTHSLARLEHEDELLSDDIGHDDDHSDDVELF